MFFSLTMNLLMHNKCISKTKGVLFGTIISAVFSSVMVSPLFASVPVPQVPQVPKAKGEKCVEKTEYMRRNHMDLLKHQRDDTMRKGIRTKKHSLQGCLDCHAVYDEQKVAVDIKSEKHFCHSCHSYAAVKIDCFGCHNSKPFVRKVPLKSVVNSDIKPNFNNHLNSPETSL